MRARTSAAENDVAVAADVDVDVEVDSSARGVLNAPVLCFWRRSKISCSSFGRRGGAGAFAKGEERRGGVVVRVRRERWRGRRRSERGECMVVRDLILGW